MPRAVLVLNHFAVPRGQAGGTRHVELFDLLPDDWCYTLISADRNLLSGDRTHRSSGSYRVVRTTPYRGNGISRIINWLSFGLSACLLGVRQRRIDVVYASSPHLITALAGYLIARVRRTPFILEVRDLWPRILVDMGRTATTSAVYRVLRRLEVFLYCRADEIVILAEGSADAIRSDCPSVRSITFIPNGSDPSMFRAAANRASARERFEMNGLVFVYAGAHGLANGLDFLLDAAERIRSDLPEVVFLLVGDGVEKERLVSEVRRRELDNVRFHDPIPKSEMPELLVASDVGLHVLADVSLFRYGVSPNKLFDYMAAGLPVVTNCPGEVEKIVSEAGAGIAVGPSDLETAVRRVAASSVERRVAWGRAGRKFIEQHRSREVLAEQLARVLDRAVGS